MATEPPMMDPATLAAWALACAATSGANSASQLKVGPAGNADAAGSCDAGSGGSGGSAADPLGVNPN